MRLAMKVIFTLSASQRLLAAAVDVALQRDIWAQLSVCRCSAACFGLIEGSCAVTAAWLGAAQRTKGHIDQQLTAAMTKFMQFDDPAPQPQPSSCHYMSAMRSWYLVSARAARLVAVASILASKPVPLTTPSQR